MPAVLDPGKIIGFAQSAKPGNWGSKMLPDYADLVSRLMALLENRKAEFVVVGGIALLQYVTGRNTEDIDIILSAEQLEQIPELEVQERSDLFAYCRFGALQVDILFTKHRLFRLVTKRFAAAMDYQTGRYQTATIEGLILLRLFALPSLYRQFDFDRVAIYEADVTQLLSRTERDDAFFLELLVPHISETDRVETANLLTEIRARIKRMRRQT